MPSSMDQNKLINKILRRNEIEHSNSEEETTHGCQGVKKDQSFGLSPSCQNIPPHSSNVQTLLNLSKKSRECDLLLSDLLPYDPSVKKKERLIDGLKEYLLLLTLDEQARQAILDDELFRFDPLVGENACQIRAVKIALILRDNLNEYYETLNAIKHAKAKVETLLETPQTLLASELSLKDVLDQNGLNIPLSHDEKYLLNSFILTKTKVQLPFFKENMPLVENAYTDYKKIKEMGGVGSSFSGELIKKLRKDLAAHSSNYVADIANESVCQKQLHFLSDEYVFVHNGLKCLPYYWATRALMHYAKDNQIPIVMLAQQLAKDQNYKAINNIELYFKPTPAGYEKTCRSTINPNDPVIVLIGTTCRDLSELPDLETWEKELLEECPIDLVLSYAAAHRQYPAESHPAAACLLEDSHYQYHKTKAAEWGCSMENPSRFFLTHAFCDKIKNINSFPKSS